MKVRQFLKNKIKKDSNYCYNYLVYCLSLCLLYCNMFTNEEADDEAKIKDPLAGLDMIFGMYTQSLMVQIIWINLTI